MMPDAGILAPILDDGEPVTPKELHDWRREHKLTQAALAKHLEISLGRIRKYEQGDRPIPPYFWRVLRDLERDLKQEGQP